MQSNLPKIKTKYTFILIDTTNNKLKQKKETHNEMTPYFWWHQTYYSSGLELWISSDTTKPNIAEGKIDNVLFKVSASSLSYVRKNTIKFIVIVPASTDYVGTIGSFGVLYNNEYEYPLSCAGQLVDAEGNPFTITKSALDKLIIEIEWEFQFASNDFVWLDEFNSAIINSAVFYKGNPFEKDCVIQACLANNIFISSIPLDKGIVSTRLLSFSNASSYCYPKSNNWDILWDTTWNTQSYNKYGNEYKYTETPATRISQESAPGRYVNVIGINGLGGVELPNSNVFPTYTLSGIEVGTGDGVLTDFECPIPWFLKDTDKLYKNGQLLTRDVDYTIDHKHNRQRCLSISEGNFAKVISGDIGYLGTKEAARQSVSIWGSPFIPFTACIDAYGDYGSAYIVNKVPYLKLHTEKPLILDMEKEVEVNCFISPYISASYIDKMQLWYSNDNNNYTKVCEVSVLKTALNGTDNIPSASIATFETISARYWKIIVTTTNNNYKEFDFPHYTVSMRELNVEETKTKMSKYCGFLGYVGEPIKFKTPPAKGDIITLDVSLDRPYKTTQNVIDIAFKYNY